MPLASAINNILFIIIIIIIIIVIIYHSGERLCDPRSLMSIGYRGIFSGVRRTRCDAKSSLHLVRVEGFTLYFPSILKRFRFRRHFENFSAQIVTRSLFVLAVISRGYSRLLQLTLGWTIINSSSLILLYIYYSLVYL
jgi:hypothetical protein